MIGPCAVVDPSGAITNMIVADAETDSLPGYTLVAIPDGLPVDRSWSFDGVNFIAPQTLPDSEDGV